ncbi:MAG: HAD hydrolase-like protein, partial [Candidatus Atribacteria bacterium]|nr:HAD hydrolase-like protein [Candidatus Atribacteria bacterium]
MFKLFIWDLDNTLIGSSRLLWSAFGMVAEKYAGKRMTPEQIVSLYGPPEGAVIETIVGKNQKEEALEDFYRFYQNHHQELVDVFWEVLAIIPFLRSQGIFQAIFTSKGRRSADITLQMLQVTSLFDTVVCGDEIPRPKP